MSVGPLRPVVLGAQTSHDDNFGHIITVMDEADEITRWDEDDDPESLIGDDADDELGDDDV